MTKVEIDKQWKEEQQRWGWKLPEVPAWKKLPVVRYVRWFYHNLRVQFWAEKCIRADLGFCINPYDEWRLWAIYRGWA